MTTCPAGCGTTTPDGLLCRACTADLRRDLEAVPALLDDLDTTISRQARIGTPGKAGPAHERTPANLAAIEAADNLRNTLTRWARDLWTGGATLRTAFPPANVAPRVLLANLDHIRRHPNAGDLTDQIRAATLHARHTIDRPADRIYLGTCMHEQAGDTCHAELYATPTASETRCKVCGITHPVNERRAWLLQRAADTLVTVREAASYMGEVGGIPVTQASIRGYLHRKRLAYRPGTTTIRLGDLIDVVMDDSERRTA